MSTVFTEPQTIIYFLLSCHLDPVPIYFNYSPNYSLKTKRLCSKPDMNHKNLEQHEIFILDELSPLDISPKNSL